MLNVGLYLKNTFPTEVNDEGLINCFTYTGNALNTKKAVSRILKELFHSEDFKNGFCDGTKFGSLLDQLLGSPSFRKCAATHGRHYGCSRDEIDLQCHWEHQKHQVDTYIDTSVPYPDAKVCAALCVGGALRYDLVVGSGLDDCWILKNIILNTSKYHFCKKAAGVFGKAILWGCFDLV